MVHVTESTIYIITVLQRQSHSHAALLYVIVETETQSSVLYMCEM